MLTLERMAFYPAWSKWAHRIGVLYPHRPWLNFRHPLESLRSVWITWSQGVRNLGYCFWTVWEDDDCDWVPAMEFMERKFQRMAELHRKDGLYVSSQRTARQLAVAAALCRRIRHEYYWWDWEHPIRKHDWAPPIGPWHHRNSGRTFDKAENRCYDNYMADQDMEHLTRLFRKYFRHWWA